jgi:hypothetical protein
MSKKREDWDEMSLFGYSKRTLYWGIWTLLGLFMTTQDLIRAVNPITLRTVGVSLGLNLGQNMIWGVVSLGTLWIVRRYPLHNHPPASHWLLHSIVSVLIVPLGLVLVWGTATLQDPSIGFGLESFVGFLFWYFSFHHLVCYWGVVGIHEGIVILQNYWDGEAQVSRLESELVETELRMLKVQLNPHFLFNALNTVSTLVHHDPGKADQMLVKLSAFLQVALEQDPDDFRSLGSEISLLRDYLEIERIRFGDQIKVNFQIQPSLLGAQIPAFILQPLVENAIKHGLRGRKAGGIICIYAMQSKGRLILEVSDNGHGRGANGAPGAGLGLRNTRQRLEQHYRQHQSFDLCFPDEGGAIARISLPLHVDSESPRFMESPQMTVTSVSGDFA